MEFSNNVKEETTTTGTGTVTLTAVAGSARFADAHAVGALVPYAIRSGNDWEWGIGTVAATNTLERTTIKVTYVAGVYDNTSPVAITLAGTSTVFVTPHADAVATLDHAHAASAITNTPAGSIAATTVQAAINELDTEKQPLDSTLTAISDETIGSFSHRNKIINGLMAIDQRNAGAAQTITANAALAYTVDCWYAYCTGANVTGQRVAGTAPNKYNYQFTGAASVTKIGFAQRIEAANCQDIAGKTATLSVDLANSLLTTVTWTAWYANTENTFGTLASPTRTQIATGTFTVSGTLTRYNAQIAIPAAATTGIEVEFSVGAQTSGTWTIGRFQFEQGSVATPFEHRSIGTELGLCQRYFLALMGLDSMLGAGGYFSATQAEATIVFPVPMRTTPTAAATTGTDYYLFYNNANGADYTTSLAFARMSPLYALAYNNTEVAGTAGQYARVSINNAAAIVTFSAVL